MADPPEDFLPGFATVDQFSQANLRKILLATKYSNELPADKKTDWDYYTTFPGFRQVMNAQGNKIRDLIKSQLDYHNIKVRCDSNDISDLVDSLCDANDALMEKININLDEAAGLKKAVNPLLLEISQSKSSLVSGSWNKRPDLRQTEVSGSAGSPADPNQVKLLAAKHVLRPQVRFKHLIDNSSKTIFIPRITEKPHSLKPLSILVEYDEQGEEYYSHPYMFEIERFTPGPDQLGITVAVQPKSVEVTELVYIDTLPALRIAIRELSMQDVIGIDVEHHSYRSYQGITCLIQISTQNKDFLIDPFHIWADLPMLNEVTANPKIVKILHGCDKDVEWLQRDFSVYLVNVFDSHQAGKLLGLPRLSLAFLLQHYCGVTADKQFQLADWRIRPLPEEMVYYARQDTRYLLYLYARMKNELISRGNEHNNLLQSALLQSNNLCKKMYKKQVVWDDSHLHLVRKSKINFNNKQLFALKEIYSWRDKTGRVEDESPGFVLPNHMLLKICSELPREMQGILACCNPVPPMVKQNLQVIHLIILAARDKPLSTVITLDEEAAETTPAKATVGGMEFLENPLTSPLDLGGLADCATQLETVLGKEIIKSVNNNILKKRPELLVFAENKKEEKTGVPKEFLSPYHRFKLLKPYLDSISKESEDDGTRTKQDRMSSIKEHFQKLTDMTPTKKKEEAPPPVEDVKQAVISEESSDEDENEGLPVKNLRGDFKKDFQKHKKSRKSQILLESKVKDEETNVPKQSLKRILEQPEEVSKIPKMDQGDKTDFDYSNIDFKTFQGCPKKNGKGNDDFNPNKRDQNKKNRGGKQKAQKYKGGGPSCTFKSKSNK